MIDQIHSEIFELGQQPPACCIRQNVQLYWHIHKTHFDHTMAIMKTIDCAIRKIPAASLKQYYKPEEIAAHCKNCPKYGLNWSCPPHAFNVPDDIARFTLAYVIGIKVPLSGYSTNDQAMDYYHHCRHVINQRLIEYEKTISEGVVLIAGHCDLCDTCSRPDSMGCRYPDQRRYSFESLGFKVSEIIADVFGDQLQWIKGKTPDRLYIVSGMLSNLTCDVHELKKIIVTPGKDSGI